MSSAIKQTSRARAQAFRAALAAGAPPFRIGQQELFTGEEEKYIQQEVARKLYTPNLPNAGAQERKWVELLRQFSWDESLVVNIKVACRQYADALEACLPAQEYIKHPKPSAGQKWLTLPGCYYTRKGEVTPKTNKGLYDALSALREEATHSKHRGKRWLAGFLMKGVPKPVSNFRMECLYLLRGADGNVTRLVRLINTKGEMSEGREIGGADMLPNEMYAGSEKFRQWVASKGNFTWGGPEGGAGNNELQALQWDVTEDAAYRVVKLIEYCGWHEIRKGKGIWFYEGCAMAGQGGKWLLPDGDGIIWHEEVGYATSSKGRELEFAHGRPVMPLSREGVQTVFEPVKKEWQQVSLGLPTLSGFFREICRRFYDTAGGPGGLMAIGVALGYAAGPEFFEKRNCLPGIFIPGEMGSGKTFFANWTMGLQGFPSTKGLGLGKGSFVTVPGLCAQLENYSSLLVWFDEFRQHEITDEKSAIIRGAYDRQIASKITQDIQRRIRTTPMVSGETTTSDAATHSRYCQLQLSRQDRLANHLEWLQLNRPDFVRIWAHLMERRPEFVELLMTNVEWWLGSKKTEHLPERNRVTYALPYAAFMAAVMMFQSHAAEEIDEFRDFIVSRAGVSAADVEHEKFVNVFIQEMITTHGANAIPNDLFRVERGPVVTDALGYPWRATELYFDPFGVMDAIEIHLRKAGRRLPLGYNDTRDQLSKHKEWWIAPVPGQSIKKRFGPPGSRGSKTAWGIRVDGHPMGRLPATEEEMKEAIDPRTLTLADDIVGDIVLKSGQSDPRKGPLFSIIEAVLKWEEDNK